MDGCHPNLGEGGRCVRDSRGSSGMLGRRAGMKTEVGVLVGCLSRLDWIKMAQWGLET